VNQAERVEQFEYLYAATKARITAYALRRASPADAADALAETYAIAWQRLEDVPAGHAGLLWLYVTARNVMANSLRARQRQSLVFERLVAELEHRHHPPPGEEALAAREALSRLRAGDRELLILIAWDGLSTTDAARVLDCSPTALRIRLHRARRRLEAALEGARTGPDTEACTHRRQVETVAPLKEMP